MLGMDDALLFAEIAKALGEEKSARRIADLDAKTTGRQFSMQEPSAGEREGIPLACKGLKYGTTKDVVRSAGRLASLLETSRERGLWKRRALVLMFDELQTVTKRQAESLAVLHQGLHGCPIMLLGVGLQHSPAVLAELGISRTKRPRHLGCLTREEAVVRDEMIALAGAMASENVADMRRREAQRAVSSADAEFDGHNAIERAIRHGVLTETDEDRVLFGIPSFHNHMVEQWRDTERDRGTRTGTSRA